MPTKKPTIQDTINAVQGVKDSVQDVKNDLRDVKTFLEDNVMTALRDHDRRFDQLEERMSKMENDLLDFKDWTVKHVTSLEEEVSMIVARLDELREKFEHFDPKDYEQIEQEVSRLELRITRLEEKANRKVK